MAEEATHTLTAAAAAAADTATRTERLEGRLEHTAILMAACRATDMAIERQRSGLCAERGKLHDVDNCKVSQCSFVQRAV